MALTINGTNGIETNADTGKIKVGIDDDLVIEHNGTNSVIDNNTGKLLITSDDIWFKDKDDGDVHAKFIHDGAVELYHDNTKRFETTSAGAKVTTLLDFDDSIESRYGTDNDLKIKHTGSHAEIDNTTGRIDITSSANDVIFYTPQIQFKNAAGTESMGWFESGGSCALKWNNNTRITTTSPGATVTGNLTETSDIALKEDIKPLSNSLSNLKQLNGYSYKFKETGNKAIGLTAQDVEKVYPDLVTGDEGEKGLHYSGLIAPLIEAIKELSTEVDTLKTKVAALEAG